MTPDQQTRKTEFDRLFALIPGRTNADKLRTVVLVTGLRPGTIRQYRMATPPSVPSDQVIKLMRYHLGAKA